MAVFGIAASGQAYASIEAFLADYDVNAAANPGEPIIGEIRDNRVYAEGPVVSFASSPSATQYCELRAAEANFPSDGQWSATHAIVKDTGSGNATTISESYTVFRRLQIQLDNTSSSAKGCNSTGDFVLFTGCIFKSEQKIGSSQDGINAFGLTALQPLVFHNCVVDGFTRRGISPHSSSGQKIYIDHCLCTNHDVAGVRSQRSANDVTVRNTVSINAGVADDDYDITSNTINGSNDISGDTSATDLFTASYANVDWISTPPTSGQNYHAEDHPNKKYKIVGENAFTVTQNGTDLSAISPDARADYTKTIDGQDRSSTPNIGPYGFGNGIISGVNYDLVPHDFTDGHQLDAVTITSASQIQINNLQDGGELDNVVLTSASQAQVNNLQDGHILESPQISVEALIPDDMQDGHILESPTISTQTNVVLTTNDLTNAEILDHLVLSSVAFAQVQNLTDFQILESPDVFRRDPYNGLARRKPDGVGSAYAAYPDIPSKFELLTPAANMTIEEWHPNNLDGLTICRYQLFRDSNSIATLNISQQVSGGQWNDLFNIVNPEAGQYQLRIWDDVQAGGGGSGDWVYADAFRISISEEPVVQANDMTDGHILLNIALGQQTILQINSMQDLGLLENVIITGQFNYTLAVNELSTNEFITSPTISVIGELIPDDMVHADILDQVALTHQYQLSSNDLQSDELIDAILLDTALTAIPSPITDGHFLDALTIAVGDVVSIQNLNHNNDILENVLLKSVLALVVDGLQTGEQLDAITNLSSQTPLVSDAMTDGHLLDSVSIRYEYLLQVNGLIESQLIDQIGLNTFLNLELNNIETAEILDNVNAFFEEDLPPLERTYVVKPETLTYIVKEEDHTYVVK